ncbi:DUF4870 domain-containing protein [Actinopolymorpha rutila]|uniref:DUF4870 domain-containing protein n=1 Tax=Actinopolymorpha rutila TaxID=446787 RepID=A0A852ZH60_9ACTN|nr:DUF4870 domain-containing protein [Actinopolymorpha rutila]NYH90992.1 hypothetical protein [Actinopolymorpha rutila]
MSQHEEHRPGNGTPPPTPEPGRTPSPSPEAGTTPPPMPEPGVTPTPSPEPGAFTPSPPQQPSAGAGAMTVEEERNWAFAAHLGSFVAAYVALGFLCPLIVLLAKGKDSAYVRYHAVESLNFQLTTLLAAAVAGLLVIVVIGLVLLPFIGIAYVVLVILASVAARRGEWYRYPVNIRFVK